MKFIKCAVAVLSLSLGVQCVWAKTDYSGTYVCSYKYLRKNDLNEKGVIEKAIKAGTDATEQEKTVVVHHDRFLTLHRVLKDPKLAKKDKIMERLCVLDEDDSTAYCTETDEPQYQKILFTDQGFSGITIESGTPEDLDLGKGLTNNAWVACYSCIKKHNQQASTKP